MSNALRIDAGAPFEVRVVGSVERIMTNRAFLNALTQISGRRGAIAGRVRARIRALEELRDRAVELVADF